MPMVNDQNRIEVPEQGQHRQSYVTSVEHAV